MWFDAHIHLDWFFEPAGASHAAAEKDLGMLAVTVRPEGFLSCRQSLEGEKNVALAAGLHPWWVREAGDADALCELLRSVRWVGEVGLDASPRHAATWDAQLAAFGKICETCAQTSSPDAPKALSIHAVRAAGPVLDVLERTGAAERCRCVLHWFSGTSDELTRAWALGCWVSFGERSLATRRGRAYARSYPAGRLLVETDLPPSEGSALGAGDVVASLRRAIEGLAAARGVDADEAGRLATESGLTLLFG